MTPPQGLINRIAEHAHHQPGVELQALSTAMRERFGAAVAGVLYYGSCLRGGDPRDGLVDLYVVVDGYRDAYGAGLSAGLSALFNRLLPPNVYYLEVEVEGQAVRAKYAVVSLVQLQRACSPAWFQGYFWGRFAQPIGLLYSRDADAAGAIHRALAQAVVTFLSRTIPALPPNFDSESLWQQALAISYAAELRAEKAGRGAHIVGFYRDYFDAITRAALPALPFALEPRPQDAFRARVPPMTRRLAPLVWWLRRLQGKLLSIARLVKAVFTFQGGIDYLAWKLERHSGQTIEVEERVRKYPLIFVWGLMWRLYRRGVFK